MHNVIEDEEFRAQVEALGGFEVIDIALSTIMDGLCNNPSGFYRFEHEEYSFRYAKTHPIEDLPAFTVIFILDRDGNVYLKQIEEDVVF